MPLVELLLLSLALAMDCFTVSVCVGIAQRRMGAQAWAMGGLFGLFQGAMPVIGYVAAALLSASISAYDHWVAFTLLLFVGGKMVRDGVRGQGQACAFNASSPLVLLTLATATSIDALAIGFSLPAMGVRSAWEMLVAVAVIGLGSLLMSLFGKYIGVTLGRRFRWPALQTGGGVLILIGVKVLVEHLAA